MKRKIFAFLSTILLLTSCSFGHIKDKNGKDDYSIATISEEEMINGSNYVALGFFSTHIFSTANCNSKKFSGVKTIATVNIESENENIVITSSVTSGNFMLIFVKDEVIEVKAYANSLINVSKASMNGLYEIKVVGESASFDVEITNL